MKSNDSENAYSRNSKDIRGLFIKRHRNLQGISLEALAHGICSISYLSKIENNEVIANDEIYSLLFKKLQITNLQQEDYVNQKQLIDTFFDAFTYATDDFENIATKLLQEEAKFNNTDLFLYYQIAKAFAINMFNIESEKTFDLDKYTMYMDDKEMYLYRLYNKLINYKDEKLFNEEVLQIRILRAKGYGFIYKKQFISAYNLFHEAYNKAAQSCKLELMADLLMNLGYVCTYFDLDASEDFYLKAVSLVNDKAIKVKCYYNIGSIFLTNCDTWNKGNQYLEKGLAFCDDLIYKNDYIRNLFIYNCLIENENGKSLYFKKLKKSELHDLLSIMNSDKEYDKNSRYCELIEKTYKQNEDNQLFKYLYVRNQIKNRNYKKAFKDYLDRYC